MTLSKDACCYLDNFAYCDTEGPTMRALWAKIAPAEREEIHRVIREQTHAKNADHAIKILRDLPKKWRDAVMAHFNVSSEPSQPGDILPATGIDHGGVGNAEPHVPKWVSYSKSPVTMEEVELIGEPRTRAPLVPPSSFPGAPSPCPACGALASVTFTREEDRFPYGVPPHTVELSAPVDQGHCSACSFEFTDWRAEEARNKAVQAYLANASQSSQEVVRGFAPGVDAATNTFSCPKCQTSRDCQALNPKCFSCGYQDPRRFLLPDGDSGTPGTERKEKGQA